MAFSPFPPGQSGATFHAGSHAAIAGLYERHQEATLYVANLDSKVDDEILWELFTQCGPLASINMPRERVSQQHQGFAFVEFKTVKDSEYGMKCMNMVKLYGKPLRIIKAASHAAQQTSASSTLPPAKQTAGTESGANLFLGNLSSETDERVLQETFGKFGVIAFCKIVRDSEGQSKGHGFLSFSDFKSADTAMAAMNGQYLEGNAISVSYSLKTGSRAARHGSAAERLISDLGKKSL